MSQYASTSIPKPKNWQDFENNTCELFKCVLSDPNTKAHGRSGQAQMGVDVYGRRNCDAGLWVGVQCKQKADGKLLTEDEARNEIEQAKKFKPPLSELIIVTTAPDDTNLEKFAREVTTAHAKSGLFSVHIWGWSTLEREISNHPEAIKAFSPDLTLYSEIFAEKQDQTLATQEAMMETLHELRQKIDGLQPQSASDAADNSTAAIEAVEKQIHREIDWYRDMLRQGKPATAKGLLEDLRDSLNEPISDRVRFRIITNIGAALLALGDQHAAANHLFEAIKYDPGDRVGMANIALAYLIREDMPAAINAAEAAIKSDPTNAAAAAYLIAAYIPGDEDLDPLSLIPSDLKDRKEVVANTINFYCSRQNNQWRVLAKEAVQKWPDEEIFRQRAAEAVLEETITDERYVLGGWVDGEHTPEDVARAVAELDELWQETLRKENAINHDPLPLNLSQGFYALGQKDRSVEVLEQALVRAPDSSALMRQLAVRKFESGDVLEARRMADRVPPDPQLLLLLAQSYVHEAPGRARKILGNQIFEEAEEPEAISATRIQIATHLQEGDTKSALAAGERLVKEYPHDIIVLLDLVRLQKRTGEGEPDATLKRAIEALNENTSMEERCALAQFLGASGRYDDAVEVLKDHVGLAKDSPALGLLLKAYINADMRSAARKLLDSMPPEVAGLPEYIKARAVLHMRRQKHEDALTEIDRYLQMRPYDLEMRLSWIDLSFRFGRTEPIKEFLSDPVEELSWSPEQRIDVATWLARIGLGDRALAMGYETLLRHPENAKVNLKYAGMLLQPDPGVFIPTEVSEIGNDIAFQIENEFNDTLWFVIEPNEGLRIGNSMVAPSDHVAEKARGLKVGDSINWAEWRRPWSIKGIKHKYLHLLHQTLESFNTRFPEEGGLRRVMIDPASSEPLKPIEDEMKAWLAALHNTLDVYERKGMPLQVCANVLGLDLLDTRRRMLDVNREFKVSSGTHVDRIAAIRAIEMNDQKGCVVDALTLIMIRRLGIDGVVEQVCGPIGVTGSTRDLLWVKNKVSELDSAAAARTGSISILDYQYDDLDWIDAHAEIIPAESIDDAPEGWRRLGQTVGINFQDDALAAKGSDRLLLCQDLGYRQIAFHFLNVRSAWLQTILMVAKEQGLISDEEYADAAIAMIEVGDHGLSIDGSVLNRACDKGDNTFFTVTQILGGLNADPISHAAVAASFLQHLWVNHPYSQQTWRRTSRVLERLCAGRRDWYQVIAIFRRWIAKESGRIKLLDRYMLNWLKGHFLLPFNASTLPIVDRALP